MSFGSWVLLALLGGAGAVARVEVGAAVTARVGKVWIGTLAVNIAGAFLLGLTHASLSGSARTTIAIGLLGAFTTFSTWMLEAERAATARQRAVIVIVPLVLGLAAAALGNAVGSL
ncbi:MAG TPA: CrcB family protein [Baekduia sp.]|nr:CrcB family protein [Baekduia sp.]